MKFLISDYSSEYTTEPLYLNTIFNSIGCNSTVAPRNLSAFDAFDLTSPNIFVTHFSKITRDVVYYLRDKKDIEIIVNITNLSKDGFANLESTLYDNKIYPLFFFVNAYDHPLKSQKTNIHSILHSADVLLGKSPKMYDIECGIMVDNPNQIAPIGKTYHYLSNNQSLEDAADIVMPEYKLTQFYSSYKKVIFKYFHNVIPQAFFDAAYYGQCVFYDIEDRTSVDNHLKKLFGEAGLCMNEVSGSISDKIKQKHTCLHRAKSFLSQLACKEFTDKLQNLIEEQLK